MITDPNKIYATFPFEIRKGSTGFINLADVSLLSARIAMRLNSLSLQKKFSIRCRHLYISRSRGGGFERLGCWEMTTVAPLSFSSAMMTLLSNALSAIKASNSRLSISGDTSTLSKRWPGIRRKRTRLPKASVSAGIFVVMPPFERPMAWPCVPLLRPAHDDEPSRSLHTPYPDRRIVHQKSV